MTLRTTRQNVLLALELEESRKDKFATQQKTGTLKYSATNVNDCVFV